MTISSSGAGLNGAALRRTLARARCQKQWCERDEEIGLGHKEMTYDPPSQNDARGTRASQLRSDYQRLLHPDDRGLRALLQAPSRPTRSRAHPPLPSLSVPREETRRTYRHATAGRAAVLLHPDDEEAMERGRYPVSEEGATPAQHIEPRRSCPPHRLGPDSISSHRIDDSLWHRGTACRVGSIAARRYRQPTHGHPHSRRERLSGPGCHAQSRPAGSFTGLLARAGAQTFAVVVPRGL